MPAAVAVPSTTAAAAVAPAAAGGSGDAAHAAAGEDVNAQLASIVPFLSRNLSRIKAAQAVQLLPPSVSLAAVAPLLETAIRAQQGALHMARTSAQLATAYHGQVAAKLAVAQAPGVIVDQTVKCCVCSRRVAAGLAPEAYVVTPAKRVAHLRCTVQLSNGGGVAVPATGGSE